MHFISTVQKLLHCESGVTALEFAIVAPVFVLLLMGIIEYSLILFADSTMESSLNVAAREAKTGSFYNCPNPTTELQFVTNITSSLASGVLLNSGPPPTNNTGCPTSQTVNGLLVTECVTPISDSQNLRSYTAQYTWIPFTPFINSFFGGNGITLTSTILLNDEILPPDPTQSRADPNAIISFTHTLGQPAAGTNSRTFTPNNYGCK